MKFIDNNPEMFAKNMKPKLEEEVNKFCNKLIKTDAFGKFDRGGMKSFIKHLVLNFPIEENK